MKNKFIWLHLITFVERIMILFFFCYCTFSYILFWNDDNYRKHHLNLNGMNWNWNVLLILKLKSIIYYIFIFLGMKLDFNYGFWSSLMNFHWTNCQVSLGFCPCLIKVKIIMIFTDIKLKYWLIPWAVLFKTPHRFAPSLKD